MERLTDKKEADAQRLKYENRLKNGYPRNIQKERFLKLAAYENIGLSPETVSDLLERFSYFYRTVEGLDIVDPVHFGAFVDRVKRWQQAEKDGRLVVLPCKVGDSVYEVNKRGFISIYKVVSINISTCYMIIGWELIDGIYSNVNGFYVSELGKTVFMTREEAEAALKKREDC